MASSSAAPVGGNQIRLRHVMFAVLLPMFLFVLWHDDASSSTTRMKNERTSSLCPG